MSVKLILLLATVVASLGWGQPPTISSLQSSFSPGQPYDVTGITSGTLLSSGGFYLFVNSASGDFDITAFRDVTWLDTSTSVATQLFPPVGMPGTLTANQIMVFIPNALFATLVANPVPVTITVHEITRTSNAATFTINPPFQAVQPIMPSGTINQPYSADFATGGTPPYTSDGPPSGNVPPGLSALTAITISGTPNQTGVFNFQTNAGDFWGNFVNGDDTIEIVDVPTLTSVSPNSAAAGAGTLTITVNGTNFVDVAAVRSSQIPGSQVQWAAAGAATATPLATTFVNSTQLTAIVPSALMASQTVASITVASPGGSTSAGSPFTVIGPLGITTTSLPAAIIGSSYTYTLTGTGGKPPYTWSASGLPSSLSINPGTGVISGVAQAVGTYAITVLLRDAAQATATAQFPLVVGPPPVTIAPSSSMPSGVVGVIYRGFVYANGGTGSYTFTLGGGSLPDGLTLLPIGMVYGTPKTAGRFNFTVVATDSAGAFASADFSVAIQAATLNITGGPTGPVTAGTPIDITFTGTGGVGPYRFSLSGSLPQGTSFNNGVLSGTPTTVGAFTFRVTVTDSAGLVFSSDFTLTVTPALSLGGPLNNGKVGVPYAGQITATGGVSPYSYAGSGLPGGLSLSASGSISGTPTAAGQFTLAATVTDSKGATASGKFAITIVPADLSIVTVSLPDGVVGVAYTASLTASGGVPPYAWTVTGLPGGVTAAADGSISGTPTAAGKFTVKVSVSDASGTAATAPPNVSKSYTVTISPAPLAITTATAPNGTVGTAYTASFAASGGTAPYTFSASGLPAGLSMSAAGAISGTPTAPGAATIVVTVKDSSGASTSRSFAVTIGLPPAPPVSFNIAGISDTANPLQQPRLQVTLGSGYPVDVVVTLTLTFAPDSGGDDPTIQFSSGGRTAHIIVPAGATTGATDVGVQTGTVAGLITITAQLQASQQDVTPSPAPRRTIRIAAVAPVIVPGTLTAVRNGTGFTVILTGYVTDRELTQAIFVFNAAAGSSLQTTTLTVPLDAMFAAYFGGSSAAPFGSQFTYTQPFTVTGSAQSIASVTVTLVNRIGQSTPVTATLN
jgi:hypothetical protein